MKKVVAYVRKSTSGEDENGIERQEGSFDRQKAAILDYAKKNGITISKWYEEAVSGKSMRKRKEFLRMVKDAQSSTGQFKIILFGEYERFMRNVREAWRYEVIFDDLGIELHYSNLRNDGSEAEEGYKDMFRRMAANFSRDLARKVVQGMVRKAKMGSWLGGIPPYGYRAIKNGDGKTNLVIEEVEAKVVKDIFNKSLQGYGHKRIALYLNQKGIPSSFAARRRNGQSNQNPDGKWPGESIRAVLRNPVYIGKYRWNKRARVDCFDWTLKDTGTIEIGKERSRIEEFKKGNGVYIDRQKPQGEWILKDAAMPVIVDVKTFEKVQERFSKYSSAKWRRPNRMKYFMVSVLHCQCGNRFHGREYWKTLSTGRREHYGYYCCSGDIRKGTHPKSNRPMIKRNAVDSLVMEGIKNRIEQFQDVKLVKARFKEQFKDYIQNRPNRLMEIEKELKATDKRIGRIIEAYTKFEKSIPENEVSELNAKKKMLESERQKLIESGQSGFSVDIEKEADEFVANIKGAVKALESTDQLERLKIRDIFLKRADIKYSEGDGAIELLLQWYKSPIISDSENSLQLHSVSLNHFCALLH